MRYIFANANTHGVFSTEYTRLVPKIYPMHSDDQLTSSTELGDNAGEYHINSESDSESEILETDLQNLPSTNKPSNGFKVYFGFEVCTVGSKGGYTNADESFP